MSWFRWTCRVFMLSLMTTVPALAYYVPKFTSPQGTAAKAITTDTPAVVEADSPMRRVGALGTLEPRSRILNLSAPTALEGARIERMLVQEGDTISKGAVIAVLDTAGRRQAAVVEAEANLALAHAKLEQVRAGSKKGDIEAQEAQLFKARSELKNAEIELKRAEALKAKQAISSGDFDQRALAYETAQAEMKRAGSLLDSVREVRSVDVQRAQAEVAMANAMLAKAKADYEATQLRAPIDAKVLKIEARDGERVSIESGVMEIGDTTEMNAVAEIYEADLPEIAIGQKARIVLPSTGAEYAGRVIEIGYRIGRKVILDNDPVADTDARVVEVRIRIDAEKGHELAGLSNARVRVVIETTAAKEKLK